MEKFVRDNIKNQTCNEPLSEHRSEKIRIAVIDSGLSINDPIVRHARKHNKVRKCRNFSSQNPEDWDDKLGHGTMMTRLLLEVAPEAELFIAKVSSNKEQYIPKSKLYCIAKVSDAGSLLALDPSCSLIKNTANASVLERKGYQLGSPGLERRHHHHVLDVPGRKS
jgi:hypothetical protein